MLWSSVLFAAMATFVAVAHARDPALSTSVTSAGRAVVNLVLLVALERGDVRGLLGDGRRALWGRGVFGAGALLCYFAAIQRLSMGEAAFLNQTSAVWVAAAAPFVLGERAGALTWVAILGSLGGVALLGHPRTGVVALAGDAEGRLLGVVSGVLAAAAYVSIRRAAATNRAAVIVFYFTLVATVAAVGLAVAQGAALPRDPWVWACIAGAGASATWAQLAMTEAYRIGPAATVAAVGATGPLMTAVAGWIVLGQAPDASALAGMGVLVVTGVLLPIAGRR
jgi:drug/metabolite transporter (DMT)-like permease